MKQSLFLAACTALLAGAPVAAQQIAPANDRLERIQDWKISDPTPLPNPNRPIQAAVQGAPLNLRGGAKATGLQGYYDYQSNGMSPHWLAVDPKDPQKLHAVYMLATDNFDSVAISSSRRVGYTYSSDGGATWSTNPDIGGMRLGFPYIELSADGEPFVITHGDLTSGVSDGTGVRTLLYAAEAGKTAFNRIAKFPRRTISNRDGDGGAGVIWPAFEFNPKDGGTTAVCIASLSPRTGEQAAPLQFSIASIGADVDSWVDFNDSVLCATSGGRYVLASSAGGKIGMVYHLIVDNEGTNQGRIVFSESTDGGNSWSDPVAIFGGGINTQFNLEGDEDTLTAGNEMDIAYVGETAHVVFTGSLNNLYRFESVWHWAAGENGIKQVAAPDFANLRGVYTIPRIKAQPGFSGISYPTISTSEDGHVFIAFMAGGQVVDDSVRENIVSADGFLYYRVWGVGSPDGGANWGDAFVLQDWADIDGGNTDSASIEYPSAGEAMRKVGDNYEHLMTFQARRDPGMYAFISDGSERGPGSECFQYFQRTMLTEANFLKIPSAVDNHLAVTNRMAINSAFPNPTSGLLTVNYTLVGGGEVSLKLYNSLGDVVMAPVNAENGYNGQHSRTLDLSGVPAGPYRIVLSQNGQSVSTPLNVVR
ncbi:MAG: hypothetical protein UZ07_CHB004001389 [Chlorobi bacterium OLB7]|nr:MAG: hypothetical protein UZ07_CHB004001389 [Chlorobi bacterium OLB7]